MSNDGLMELVNDCGVAIPIGEPKVTKNRAVELRVLGFEKLATEIFQRVERNQKLALIGMYRYPIIKPENIQKFLQKKADEYNNSHGGKKKSGSISNSLDSLREMWGPTALRQREMQNIMRQHDQLRYGMSVFYDINRQLLGQATGANQALIAQEQSPGQPGNVCFRANTCDASSYEPGTIGNFSWVETPIREYAGMPPDTVIETFKEHRDRKIFDYFTIAEVKGIKDPLLLGRFTWSDNRYFIAQWGEDVCLDDVI
jgi:hypothetical protein